MSDNVGIRPAGPDDLADLIALDSAVETDPERADAIARWLATATHDCFVATIDARPVGYGVLHHNFFNHALLEMLMVAAPLRGHGIGKALIEHAMTVSRTSLLWITTNQSNLAMRHLLGSMGFIPSGTIEGLDEGDPELVFRIITRSK